MLFARLDSLSERLATRRYLVGDTITEADVRLWPTLVRFDAVYHGHFKCNRNKITEMPVLWAYARDLFQTPGFGDTIDFAQTKQHYYRVHTNLNPSQIVPAGPDLSGWLTRAPARGTRRPAVRRRNAAGPAAARGAASGYGNGPGGTEGRVAPRDRAGSGGSSPRAGTGSAGAGRRRREAGHAGLLSPVVEVVGVGVAAGVRSSCRSTPPRRCRRGWWRWPATCPVPGSRTPACACRRSRPRRRRSRAASPGPRRPLGDAEASWPGPRRERTRPTRSSRSRPCPRLRPTVATRFPPTADGHRGRARLHVPEARS